MLVSKFDDVTASLSYLAIDALVHGSDEDLKVLLKYLKDYREFLELIISHVSKCVYESEVK